MADILLLKMQFPEYEKNMAYNVRIMEKAEEDLSEIVDYISDTLKNQKAADNLLIEFFQEKENIAEKVLEKSAMKRKAKNEIILEERELEGKTEEWAYLEEYYNAEKNIAEKLIRLRDSRNIKKISGFALMNVTAKYGQKVFIHGGIEPFIRLTCDRKKMMFRHKIF